MTHCISIKIPSPLRRFTGEQNTVPVQAATVADALQSLFETHPDIRSQIVDEQGRLRNFVNLYLDQVDVKQRDGLDTRIEDDAELRIVPAIAGGQDTLPELDPAEMARYSRHIMLPQIGKTGQQQLKAARVLIVGAGGLGSPLCLYLAAAGVGTLGIVDHDRVDESNLQRQVLFGTSDIGKSKAVQAASRIADLNPYTQVQVHDTILSADNAMEIIRDYDLVIDGTDNFPTRYLVNDACVFLDKPNVYGSIFRFDGQASVFHYQGGPCYRCLFPEPPPAGMVPSCAEGGVLGILPALIASIQATEAIKIITGLGDSLSGRLLLYDALGMIFHPVQIKRNPNCVVCGDHPSITELIDYQEFCGVPSEAPPSSFEDITVQTLKDRIDRGDAPPILDVREPYERDICRFDDALHIPMKQVAERIGELDPAQEIVVHCKSGGRSAKVCELLLEKGFKKPLNLRGGIIAWAKEIDPTMQTY